MVEYIEKQAAERIFRNARRAMKPEQYSGEEFFIRDNILLNAEQIIHTIPPADVRPVRRGRWEPSEKYRGYVSCSICHDCYIEPEWVTKSKWVYCPHCGADMRGGDAG